MTVETSMTPVERQRYYREARRKHKHLNDGVDECYVCGGEYGLNTHHRDGDLTNNYFWNLITLCNSCHGKVHHPEANVYDQTIKQLRGEVKN